MKQGSCVFFKIAVKTPPALIVFNMWLIPMSAVTDNVDEKWKEKLFIACYCSQKYRNWQASSSTISSNAESDEQLKNERSESGFDSINDGIFNSNHGDIMHIPLNIPLPPSRTPPQVPIAISDFSPQLSPVPIRKFPKQPIPDINFIESTPSPVLKGNHDENLCLIESDKSDERSWKSKIDELNDEALERLSKSNIRKEGIIAETIKHDELDLDIRIYPKDRLWVLWAFCDFFQFWFRQQYRENDNSCHHFERILV